MVSEILGTFRRKMIGQAVFAFLILVLAACGSTGQVRELILLHTNDSHGSVLPVDSIGGLAERATFIRQVREQNPYVLLVDAGDINTGQPLSNMADAHPDILAYNAMGYDAVTVGNHEFDKPVEILLAQMKLATFPFITSNVKWEGKPLGTDFLIKEINGIKIGVFGVVTKYTQSLSVQAGSVVFEDEVETAQRIVKLFKDKKVDVIIGLTHLGFTETTPDFVTSRKLAAQVDGLDILVDGHSHSYLDKPERINNTWIVSANQSGRYVGEGKLIVKDGRLTDFIWKPVLVKGFAPDSNLNVILQPFIDAANQDLGTVVGIATEAYPLFQGKQNIARYGESALGDLIADALKWKADNVSKSPVDFAVTNSGGIREGLPKGEIKKVNVLTTLPFSNMLEVIEIKGSDVRRLFDFQASVTPGNGAFAQVSAEVRVVYNKETHDVAQLTIQGKPVIDSLTYRIAICDYIAAGKDGYDVLGKITNRETTSLLMSEAVADYIKMKGTITPRTDGRIRFAR